MVHFRFTTSLQGLFTVPSIRYVLVFHTTRYVCDSRMSKVYRVGSRNGKYIGLGFNGTDIVVSHIQRIRPTLNQIRRRWMAARSSTSQGRAEPCCARITGTNRGVESWCLTTVFFFLRGPQGAANRPDSWDLFKGTQGFRRLDAGSLACFTSSTSPPPWTSVFQFFLLLYDVWPWKAWTYWSKLVGA